MIQATIMVHWVTTDDVLMSEPQEQSFINQLKIVFKDGLNYLNSVLTLQQARLTSFGLSAFLFILQVTFASLLALTAFILLNIAAGIALNHYLNNVFWTLAILSGFYGILAWLVSRKALQWLKNLKS